MVTRICKSCESWHPVNKWDQDGFCMNPEAASKVEQGTLVNYAGKATYIHLKVDWDYGCRFHARHKKAQ